MPTAHFRTVVAFAAATVINQHSYTSVRDVTDHPNNTNGMRFNPPDAPDLAFTPGTDSFAFLDVANRVTVEQKGVVWTVSHSTGGDRATFEVQDLSFSGEFTRDHKSFSGRVTQEVVEIDEDIGGVTTKVFRLVP